MSERRGEGDDLFGLRPEDFTSARNALAKRLKSGGDIEEAARVAALRRPTVTAWALNQLARGQPDLVEAVTDAGDKLRQATEQALGGDRSGFPAAQATERGAIQRAVDGASKLLKAGGGKASETARQRMTETLRAATVDDSAADRLRRGVLESDLSAPGFGMEGLIPESVSRPSSTKPDDDARQRQRESRHAQLQTDLDEAAARLEEAKAVADEAESRAAQLRRQAERAHKEFGRAKKRLDDEVERSS